MSGPASTERADRFSLETLVGPCTFSTVPGKGDLNGRVVTVEQEEEGCCLWACLRAIFCFTEEDIAPTRQFNNKGVEILSRIEEVEETNLEEPSASEMEMQRRKASSENSEERDSL